MVIAEALKESRELLQKGGIENPALDAEVILCHVLNCERHKLIVNSKEELSSESLKDYQNKIKRRLKFEPIAYILGSREFYSLDFIVNKDVLIPRPETELLVDLVIYYAGPNASVLDLGTGSGAIAVAVKHNRKDLQVWASDVSEKALKVAKRNAVNILGAGAITFEKGDLFSPFEKMSFNVIVSNPPYVDRADFPLLQKELSYEPDDALFADEKGTAVIERIISSSAGFLTDKGYLILEISYAMKDFIYQKAANHSFTVSVLNDYAGLPRVAILRNT